MNTTLERILDAVRLILIIGLVSMVYFQGQHIKKQTSSIKDLNFELIALQDNIGALHDNIDDQNTFITQNVGANTAVNEEIGTAMLRVLELILSKVEDDIQNKTD
jgi:hypothetical protein